MTLSNTNTRMDYTGNGAVSNYSFTFKIFANSHLQVTQRDTDDVETLLVLDTDYTVTGAGDTSGGSITLTAGNLPSSYILTILRIVPVTQDTDFRNQGDFFPDIHEDQFDLTTMAEQQIQEEADRTMTLPVTVSGVSSELPVPVALKWWRYNAGATALELVDAGDLSAITTVGADLVLAGSNLSIANPNRLVAAGGTVDVITGTSDPAAASLTNGLIVILEAAGANATTTPTFNLDALSAKTIVKGSGTALVAGDIPGANYRAYLVYDLSLTQWILLNPYVNPNILPIGSAPAPSIGWTDTGFYESSADVITAAINGAAVVSINSTGYVTADAAGPAMFNEAATATNPTLLPNGVDIDTGIGWVSADLLALVCGGVGSFYASTTALYGSDAAGGAILNEAASATNPTLIPNRADLTSGIGTTAVGAVSGICSSIETFRADGNVTAAETRFMIYDVDNATLERVSVGAADSGGAGFKVLRIPN